MFSSRQTKRLANRNFLTRVLQVCGVAVLVTCTEFALAAVPTATGFNTNFNPVDINGTGVTTWSPTTIGYCNPSEGGACTSHIGDGDPTPMGFSTVQINGVLYFHTLVGDPASGFALESYTRASSLAIDLSSGAIVNSGGAFSPDSGGNERAAMTLTDNTPFPANVNFLHNSTNMGNALGNYDISGTGSQDPTKTVFRMVLSDVVGGSGMSMEVYKPFLDKKPRISQTVVDNTVATGKMTSVFVTDQTALSYSDSSTAAPVVNNVVIDNPDLPSTGSADFEMALAQTPDVTSGRFIYTPGTGWLDPVNGWDQSQNPSTGTFDPSYSSFGEGNYSYVDGAGFDPLNFDWSTVFDYSQNSTACETAGRTAGSARNDIGAYGGSCFNGP